MEVGCGMITFALVDDPRPGPVREPQPMVSIRVGGDARSPGRLKDCVVRGSEADIKKGELSPYGVLSIGGGGGNR